VEILSKIIEILKTKIALPVFLLTLFLLVAPNNLLVEMNLLHFVADNKTVLWLFFLFSGFLYIHEKGINLAKYIKQKLQNRQVMNSIIRSLNSLSAKEEALIYYCLRENKQTVIAQIGNSTVISLEAKYILRRPSGNYDILEVPFTIVDRVWRYLIKNKNIFCPEEKLGDESYNKDVKSFINDLRNVLR